MRVSRAASSNVTPRPSRTFRSAGPTLGVVRCTRLSPGPDRGASYRTTGPYAGRTLALGPRPDVPGRAGGYRSGPSVRPRGWCGMTVGVSPIRFSSPSAFAVAEAPTSRDLQTDGRVRFLVVSGIQDDALWGPVGALWRSHEGGPDGFIVNRYARWSGSEVARGYRGALGRGWTHAGIYDYWSGEIWRGSYAVDDEQSAETLSLLLDLVRAL